MNTWRAWSATEFRHGLLGNVSPYGLFEVEPPPGMLPLTGTAPDSVASRWHPVREPAPCGRVSPRMRVKRKRPVPFAIPAR